ncbi:MAG: glycosyltransferase family 9 protein [Verrucomicrobiota bacterium]
MRAHALLNRILVIRGGAIGDFVLTLPAIKLLRDHFSCAHLEILGYKHIIALAEKRFYADVTRSIEYAGLAKFFAKEATLSRELMDYFGSFDLIVGYLFDPDKIFENNVRRCGIKNFIAGPAQLGHHEHASRQLARPLEKLDLRLEDPGARIYPSATDREVAQQILHGRCANAVVIHPGSGSETKNWPIEKWHELGEYFLARDSDIFVVTGEADEDRAASLQGEWKQKSVRFVKNLPLPQLAALFEDSIFIGHDSGISHIAAAVGARCLLLFGPTDPAVWAPTGTNVTVVRAPSGRLASLRVEEVIAGYELIRIGINT